MKQRLGMLTLGVRDLARARRFYEEGLGWHHDAGQDDIAMYQCGGMVFSLYEWPKLAEDAGVSAEGSGFRGFTLAYNCRSKEEVRAAMEEARAAGAQILIEPRDTFWGGYDGYFADPEGHLWEVAWNPTGRSTTTARSRCSRRSSAAARCQRCTSPRDPHSGR
ncbi:MAG: VOC family protein, partial [Gemmatimonadetes bacterium]|nr:VOC family protein [Gemmatimonadota bacterium]